ncbi:hypothetical protein GGR95_002220 [Sulfitobacter undariae]|uniref:Voltage gated chloride channel n=1 Tax=Sulfitobacter undariae TaxID=1563671 RepID=A0A7W6EB84_9RHOB|nr:hypothetical protein [Sulfitobacter undariae]MBB3994574.1 hypothetical protein [Sulfitobacter undariae]
MSQDIFNKRINRIGDHSCGGRTKMATGEGTATSMFSSPAIGQPHLRASHNTKPIFLGLVLGLIIGTIAAGLENTAMPWGPQFAYNDLIIFPTLLALVAGPVMAIATSFMRKRFPSAFFFSAAYFPSVIGAALIDLPLF